MVNKFKKFFAKPKLYLSEITGVLLLVLGIYFIRSQGEELKNVSTYIRSGHIGWITIGIALTFIYILLQALMYKSSFNAVGLDVSIWHSTVLYLKRNLISIFLPGGGITSLAFFTKDIQDETNEENNAKIHVASTIYALTGIFSIVVIAIPVLMYLAFIGETWKEANEALTILIFFIVLIIYLIYSFVKRGWMHRFVNPYLPRIGFEYTKSLHFKRQFILVNIFALLIDITGIAHLYIAMLAVGTEASWKTALVGYVIATLLLVISPFLRGIGAIEFSLVLVLKHYGSSVSESFAIAIIYRLFEFWLPVVAGMLSFVLRKGNMLLRVIPALLLFALGMINIVSVLTPSLSNRIKLLLTFLPIEIVPASNFLVFVIGLLLIVNSTFLFRGFRNAWRFAVLLCILSLIGHLTKAIDYEEAIIATIVLLVLVFTRKQYYIKHNRRLQLLGTETSLIIFGAIVIYGTIGFYFLDKQHFHQDFTVYESFINTIVSFSLLNSDLLVAQTHFGTIFLYSIRFSGIVSLGLLTYSLLKPYFEKPLNEEEDYLKGQQLLEKYGSSPVDYFKIYEDKTLYFSDDVEGFISYKVSGTYAVVLEEPVTASLEDKLIILKEFEEFCVEAGLKSTYYRVSESNLINFKKIGKKSLIVGQEAIVDLDTFTLEGKDKKSMRNGLNSIQKKGFQTKIYTAPIKDGLLQKLNYVSDNWLKSTGREEMVFSQGMFDWDRLKNQTIITVENEDEQVFAFLNIIPDYAPEEVTYDLIRKVEDAPGGMADCLIVALINHSKEIGYKYLNMGLAPLSGIEVGKDLPEKTIKFAYEKLQQFKHYQGLRDFKDKFNPSWHSKYLIYENHYDLISLPKALNKAMKP